MPKLNQIIAVVAGKKSRVQSAIDTLKGTLQKSELLNGIARVYRPKDDDGEKLPPESKRLQVRVTDMLATAEQALTELFDVTATQDVANTLANASIVVDGTTILQNVPVTTLLFLEKQLVELRTLFDKLPTLDPAEEWQYSDEAASWATKAFDTVRTKKIPRNHVLAEATKEHPAQVQVFTEDVVAGYWSTTKFSGAIPESQKRAILNRVSKLQDAVKAAREEANDAEVADVKIAKPIFAYLLGAQT
jgi:hypothetical protein